MVALWGDRVVPGVALPGQEAPRPNRSHGNGIAEEEEHLDFHHESPSVGVAHRRRPCSRSVLTGTRRCPRQARGGRSRLGPSRALASGTSRPRPSSASGTPRPSGLSRPRGQPWPRRGRQHDDPQPLPRCRPGAGDRRSQPGSVRRRHRPDPARSHRQRLPDPGQGPGPGDPRGEARPGRAPGGRALAHRAAQPGTGPQRSSRPRPPSATTTYSCCSNSSTRARRSTKSSSPRTSSTSRLPATRTASPGMDRPPKAFPTPRSTAA